MDEKLKEKLLNAKITVKWNNMGTWKKENYNNLLELVEEEKIKIEPDKKLGKGFFIISWDYGCQRNKTLSHLVDIAKEIYLMLAQKCLYLGDKTKITTTLHCKDYNF